MMIAADDAARLRKAGYVIVGSHSAAKVCLWTKRALLDRGFCYKQKFYGISSHRCLQMTPTLPFCTQRCLFCWRDTRLFSTKWEGEADEPAGIIDGCVDAQRLLLNGFKGNPDINLAKFKEAQNPNQAAISLDGEPTLYPQIGEMIAEFKRRDFTTFLVTNGTNPKTLASLPVLPTNLYVSSCAPDEATYKKVCAPTIRNGWKRLNETLALFPSIKTRKVMRLTLVRGLNLKDADGYAKLIAKAEPDFVEAKAYMALGASRLRLGPDYMPTHEEIRAFAKELADASGYKYKDEQTESRVVLLCK